jgi:filamentous hemagglutinin
LQVVLLLRGGTGNNGCTQVETPVPGGPQGTSEGNAKLIKYQGGKRVDDNPIGRDKKGVAQ